MCIPLLEDILEVLRIIIPLECISLVKLCFLLWLTKAFDINNMYSGSKDYATFLIKNILETNLNLNVSRFTVSRSLIFRKDYNFKITHNFCKNWVLSFSSFLHHLNYHLNNTKHQFNHKLLGYWDKICQLTA